MDSHFSLEFVSKVFLALSPQTINAATVGGSGIGTDIRGFNGDICGAVLLGAMPASTDLDIIFQDAPLDADGSVPESGDFAALLDTADVAVRIDALVTGQANTVVPFRINRELVRPFFRVIGTNNAATAAIAGVVIYKTLPAYGSLSDSKVTPSTFVHFK